jgi:3-hydroxy acid dehydrogenase/malonic semialdehyde reductase
VIVLVTGGTAGYGKATAERFVRAGHQVIITGRRRDRLDALAAELGVRAVTLDVRDRDAVMKLPDQVGAVDVLVNNAGLALGLANAQEADLDDWDTMVDTNIKGVTYVTRAFLPGMVERNRGHIINIGSVAGSYPYPGGNVYGASKAFVSQFSLNLRADLHGTPVRVTCIEPGFSGETEFSLVRFKGDAERARKLYENTQPLQPADIAESVFWAATAPAHVNINRIELMPVVQAFGPFPIKRG